MQKRLKLLVVDDHPVVRSGLKAFLSRQNRFEIVGEASDGVEAVQKVTELMPDVVLLDLEMPRMDGYAVTQWLDAELPNVRVLIVSDRAGVESVTRIIEAGGRGYVLKGGSLSALLEAIDRVGCGQLYFPPESAGIRQPQSALRA
jgi:DNA-binding NarL/FixJ family response regulator